MIRFGAIKTASRGVSDFSLCCFFHCALLVLSREGGRQKIRFLLCENPESTYTREYEFPKVRKKEETVQGLP